jgi:hypothetical protein
MQDKQVPAEIKARLSRLQFRCQAALMDAFASGTSAQLIDRLPAPRLAGSRGDDNQKYLRKSRVRPDRES